jgi:hypothetical protein
MPYERQLSKPQQTLKQQASGVGSLLGAGLGAVVGGIAGGGLPGASVGLGIGSQLGAGIEDLAMGSPIAAGQDLVGAAKAANPLFEEQPVDQALRDAAKGRLAGK